MIEAAENFADWACEPQRPLEERFGAELLIECTQGLWNRKNGNVEPVNYEADRLRAKARSLDPGYRPQFTRKQAERTAEVLSELTQLSFSLYNDRHLRDISFLRFCPPLVSIHIMQSEIRDWTPLLSQPGVTSLMISDEEARDLRVLGKLDRLEKMHLWLRAPWPDLSGLENLPCFRELHFTGNVLALQGIPHLNALRVAKFSHGSGFNVPLRRVSDLPAMPELRRLHLENTSELDGIERCTKLLNLDIYGYYTDVTPLAALHDLTHLFLSGGNYPDIESFTAMTALRRVTLRLDLPPDLTPLAELPCLHEIVIEHSPVVPAELDSLNSLCNPWDEEFAAIPPRPLEPLRLRVRTKEEHGDHDSAAAPRDWGDDGEMATSEARWFIRKLNRRLTRLLGKGWGHESERFGLHPGHLHLTITRPEDIDRVPEIVKALRKLFLSARHPWQCYLIIDSMARYERDLDEIKDDDDEEEEVFDAEREREEWEDARQRKHEREEFIKRKYRHQLSLETGVPVPPAPPAAAPAEAPTDTAYASNADDAEPEYDLGTKLYLFTTLTEKAAYIPEQDRALAEMLFEMKAES